MNPKKALVVVIMAGGAGTRFWPLSTAERPKQFLKIFEGESLLQKTWRRIIGLTDPERVLVLTNRDYLSLVREQLPRVPPENVIGEPVRRDTAAAVALSALLAGKRFGDSVLLTVTADHLIEPVDAFQKTVMSAVEMSADSEALYTFGLEPAYPATGYGYLHVGPEIVNRGGICHYRLLEFREKPDRETAEAYLRDGSYLWNSGMFAWSDSSILQELGRRLPNHVARLTEAVESYGRPDWEQSLAQAFARLRSISIDFGVMEKAREVRCVSASFSWNDVGSWKAVEDFLPADSRGNRVRGDLRSLDAQGNLIYCQNPEEQIVLIGLEEMVVVRAEDRTLIVPKSRSEEIKALVKSLEEKGQE